MDCIMPVQSLANQTFKRRPYRGLIKQGNLIFDNGVNCGMGLLVWLLSTGAAMIL